MSEAIAPYGSWPSPIGAALVASAGIRIYGPWAADDASWWVELRPAEDGRNVLVRADASGSPVDVTPSGFDVRTRVHEYGGGAYWIHGSRAFFCNFADQRLYRQEVGGRPVPIVAEAPAPSAYRYADGRVDPDGRWIVCVRERHEGDAIVNELVALATDGSTEPMIVAAGRDFFAAPRISSDGSRIAWLCWDHPHMPWDRTELWVGDLDDGHVGDVRRVAGGRSESIFQPEWGEDGSLYFVSDRTGWWNLHVLEADGIEAGGAAAARNLTPTDAEFGVPMWELGYSQYALLSDGRIACIYHRGGVHHLALLDPTTAELIDLDVPYTCFDPPYVEASGSRLVVVGGGPTIPHQLAVIDLASASLDVLRESDRAGVDAAYFSTPRAIEFPTDGGRTAHAHHYPPTNPDAHAPEGERPPLIVMSHGGPTAEASPELDLRKQYFTSRGFAIVDVNYGGSTGYGREYRERLYGEWGVVDVQDCINAARYLVERGEADGGRLLITGGSAGGYTTICALAWHDDFAAGASYFGLADLIPFATFTHKFELRYTDTLVGPWPESEELWRARSPIHSFDRISCPVIIFQGLEDEVVPPAQAELMVEALRAKGLPYAYIAYPGEQHGFRKAENIQRSLEAEAYFYSRVLGFELADDVEPVPIENL
jgi:dipeptidyl aminopeptidase/acylaminoacyl peptidase